MSEQLLLLNNKPYKNTVYSRWYYYEKKEQHTLMDISLKVYQHFNAKFTTRREVLKLL
jgi:hypothetical protein